jgi:kynurenine formamidase
VFVKAIYKHLCFYFVDTGISNKAAQCIRAKGVYGVGIDTASLDPGKNVIFETHQTLLEAQIFGIENMNLEKDVLPGKWLKEAINPFQSNSSATRIVPSSYLFWAGKRLVDYL